MSSVSSLTSSYSLDQLNAQQGAGSIQGTSQGGVSAKDAFAMLLQQSMSGAGQAQSTSQAASGATQSSLSADMTALGQALSSGNVSAAQQAFQALQTDFKEAQGTETAHRHHHHHTDGAGTQTASASASTQASPNAQDTTGATAVPGASSTSDSQILSLLMGMM